MANLLRLLPNAFFKDLENEAIVSVVLALQRNNKVVTGQTAKSVKGTTSLDSSRSIANIGVLGGGGLPFIIKDKPPNTKLPLRKVGDSFELVPSLKAWKRAVGFAGSDFLLARAIAKNPRPAIDIAGEAMDIFIKRTSGKIPKAFAKIVGAEIKKNFDESQKNK
jgi:hypothetical protein